MKSSRIILRAMVVVSTMAAMLAIPSMSAPTGHKDESGAIETVRVGDRLELFRDSPDPYSHTTFMGEIDGDYKYLIKRYNGNRAMIEVYYNGQFLFQVPDEEVGIDGSGNWKPGETSKGYHFYLSPDHKFFFVQRGLIIDCGVAQLYKKSGQRWVRAGEDRFDDAALYYYCDRRHLDADKLAGPSRLVHFKKWDARRGVLVFTMVAASFLFSDQAHRGDIAIEWRGECRLRDLKFRILSDKVTRFKKPGMLPR